MRVGWLGCREGRGEAQGHTGKGKKGGGEPLIYRHGREKGRRGEDADGFLGKVKVVEFFEKIKL